MKNKGIWEVIPKEKILERKRRVKSIWVFKIKRNGIFRAILVVCRYNQVPFIDFNKSYTPVTHDVSFIIILIGMMIWNLKTRMIAIETLFRGKHFHGNTKCYGCGRRQMSCLKEFNLRTCAECYTVLF
jgi:hypothetical protein